MYSSLPRSTTSGRNAFLVELVGSEAFASLEEISGEFRGRVPVGELKGRVPGGVRGESGRVPGGRSAGRDPGGRSAEISGERGASAEISGEICKRCVSNGLGVPRWGNDSGRWIVY